MRLFSNRSQMTSKCGKNKKVAHEAQLSVSLMFLPHFDVLCYLLPNRRTSTWNLLILFYINYKKIKTYGINAFLFQISHFDRHENSTEVISCLYKMKRTDWLLCLAKNCDWFKLKKLKKKNESSGVVIYASVL